MVKGFTLLENTELVKEISLYRSWPQAVI